MMTLTEMPKYETYKDSGVEWIGEIPKTWFLRKAKYLLSEVNVRSENGDETLLSLSKYHGVIPKDSLEERSGGAASLIGYKKVSVNQLVINKMQAVNGLLAVSNLEGITSPDYSVYEAKGIYSSNVKYLEYLLIQPEYLAEFKRRVTGVMEGFIRLYTDDLFAIQIVQPSVEEQTRIVAFLDEKTAKIDEAIAIKEKQIELLKERKQIIIQQAVTQGLDPTVPMKDSGVEWIGQIPAHWEVTKLKYLSNKIVDGTHFTPTYVDQGIPFLRVTDLSNMVDGKINWQDVCYIPEKEHQMLIKRAKGEQGDVLISKNGTVGLTKVIDWDEEFSFFVSLCLIKLRKEISPYYFTSFFSSPIVDQQITFGSSKTSVTNLHLEKIKELLVILPPLNEQNDIDEYVKAKSKDLDLVIFNLQLQIEKLKEYKTTLINSAVTGKIKVV